MQKKPVQQIKDQNKKENFVLIQAEISSKTHKKTQNFTIKIDSFLQENSLVTLDYEKIKEIQVKPILVEQKQTKPRKEKLTKFVNPDIEYDQSRQVLLKNPKEYEKFLRLSFLVNISVWCLRQVLDAKISC